MRGQPEAEQTHLRQGGEGRRRAILADGLVANCGAHEIKEEHEAAESKYRLDDAADEGIELEESPSAHPAAQDAPTTSVPTRMATAMRVETWSQLIFFGSAKIPIAPFPEHDPKSLRLFK